MLNINGPIGIFDSGVGGLTTAHAVNALLPYEKIIYFGDVAHHPYGEKSPAALQNYTLRICDFLLSHQSKLILIACHSASSAAYDIAKLHVGNKAHVVNVIEPVIHHLKKHFSHHTIGLIGTRCTVNSQVYEKKIRALNSEIILKSIATPLLAPMIEEGYANHNMIDVALKNYLSPSEFENIQALLLACTHYPLIKNQISAYYQNKIPLIDSAEITAQSVKELLDQHQLLRISDSFEKPKHQFFVSDYTQSFVESARFFFPDTLHFEAYPLWD